MLQVMSQSRRIAIASLALIAASIWSRYAAKLTSPGYIRLVLSAPALLSFVSVPFLFDPASEPLLVMKFAYVSERLPATKALALCFGRGVLQEHLSSSSILEFVALTLCPLLIRTQGARGSFKSTSSIKTFISPWTSLITKLVVLAAVLAMVQAMPMITTPTPFFHMLQTSRLFPGPAAITTACEAVIHQLQSLAGWIFKVAHFDRLLLAVGMYAAMSALLDLSLLSVRAVHSLECDAPFNAPYAATSLSDFWARRWNLPQSQLLKDLIYDPIVEGRLIKPEPESSSATAAASKPAGSSSISRMMAVLATFTFSGVEHIVFYWYLTRTVYWPWLCFFTAHGVFLVLESRARKLLRTWQSRQQQQRLEGTNESRERTSRMVVQEKDGSNGDLNGAYHDPVHRVKSFGVRCSMSEADDDMDGSDSTALIKTGHNGSSSNSCDSSCDNLSSISMTCVPGSVKSNLQQCSAGHDCLTSCDTVESADNSVSGSVSDLSAAAKAVDFNNNNDIEIIPMHQAGGKNLDCRCVSKPDKLNQGGPVQEATLRCMLWDDEYISQLRDRMTSRAAGGVVESCDDLALPAAPPVPSNTGSTQHADDLCCHGQDKSSTDRCEDTTSTGAAVSNQQQQPGGVPVAELKASDAFRTHSIDVVQDANTTSVPTQTVTRGNIKTQVFSILLDVACRVLQPHLVRNILTISFLHATACLGFYGALENDVLVSRVRQDMCARLTDYGHDVTWCH